MFGPFERAVAGRYLHARRGERFVSVIAIFSLVGIALGVATLIIVMSVMNGFKADLLGRILGLNGDLSVYGISRTISDYDALAGRIRKVPGVESANPLIEAQVLLNSGGYNAGGLVRGMTQADLQGLKEISGSLVAGSLDEFGSDDTIVVGTTLAERAGLSVGARLTLVSPNGAATAFGTMPRVRAYRVIAIFDAGVNDYNASYVFLPLHAAQVYFQMPRQVTQIQVMTHDAENVGPIRANIEQALGGTQVRVMDWTQSNNAFFGAVQVEQNVMFLILTLIILVAAFNVISSLIMMVKDKTADIAVLRTLGATRGAIMRIFLMCGASVGVTGTFVGTGLGIVFCLNIEHIRQGLQKITGTDLFNPEVYYLEHLPAKLVWAQVFEVIAMALVLSLLATLYPSWRAARTDPVEALRHE
ncbi:lipoprotein-releasing ABC transporter permease subunit [Novacetimonas hansenii]|uniref:Lipoprotein-releasing ABC transporter permease subunit n=3 Tax=Novacetimonas hansenii TaxID=436 RepID=A0AAW5EQE7_NOVHA|nr:lipoprotein-releasing ABC transporter permease subunit [Novacetimonas hansenii]EFG83498.1 lipoprotein releasing system, transmembrane protein, LolC/E family [Novacetimonas hansenii ATCC 23769]MBL7235342.1 lipoprotein-releasing ABC transporter permease subunit [Novacetimonas hansenii]MCJ8353535.1 lipoprotein-releasing ABC transporter permease subunit [Novacetimonas hansenii]PYD71826.1 lipoprotein-releasing system transmembrane subunit LolC [Novacetimonas hansenii]RFP03108.1 multidrug ABC tra